MTKCAFIALVRFFLKFSLVSVVAFLLCIGLGVALFPWWGPAVLERVAPGVLEDAGFSEVGLTVENFGASELSFRVERLRYHGVTLANASVTVGYHFAGLRRGELDAVTVAHPEVAIDLAASWPTSTTTGAGADVALLDRLPDRFPVKAINLNEAKLSLKSGDSAQTLGLDFQIQGRERLDGQITLRGEGVELDAQLDASWSEPSGRVEVAATVGPLFEWLKFGHTCGWLSLPEGFMLRSESLDMDAEIEFAGPGPGNWRVEALSRGATASLDASELSFGQLELEARGKGPDVSLTAKLSDPGLSTAAAGFESERLSVGVEGRLPNSLEGRIGVSEGHMTWADGGGQLTGLKGEVELASLQPLASKGQQTLQFAAIEQGELTTKAGQLRLNFDDSRQDQEPLALEIEADALGGVVEIQVRGKLRVPLSLSVRVLLDAVQLGDIAALFPEFEGRMEGVASGEVGLDLERGKLVLQPGGLQLISGTMGRFEYKRRGWLTQDPRLDVEAFISGREILEIMQDPQGATALTELAMRDLNMSKFELRVKTSENEETSVEAQIQGSRTIKGVKVPVVLDVPIRGAIEETINAVFEFQSRM